MIVEEVYDFINYSLFYFFVVIKKYSVFVSYFSPRLKNTSARPHHYDVI